MCVCVNYSPSKNMKILAFQNQILMFSDNNIKFELDLYDYFLNPNLYHMHYVTHDYMN